MTRLKGILWAVLTDADRHRLLERAGQMHATPQAHHCTLHYDCDFGDVHHYIGETFTVQTIANCWDDQIQAMTVRLPEMVYAQIAIPHITISKAEDINAGYATQMLQRRHFAVSQAMSFTLCIEFAEFKNPPCPS